MVSSLILPRSAAQSIDTIACSRRNPSLQLDKCSPPGDQRAQRDAIDRVCQAAGDRDLLAALLTRRDTMLTQARAVRFQATTCGALTLHLARTAGLENAGIHLHPIYGFVCLPGSGLKGMARAYAETVWFPDQKDKPEARRQIRATFGWAVGNDRKPGLPADLEELGGSAAGAVVFHEAWPTTWPQLEPDITNNHHTDYYQGKDDPGDWESPTLVSFLAIGTGVTFDFALSARSDEYSSLIDQAAQWLQGALVHAGAGAKTNAGYGRFILDGLPEPAAPVTTRSISQHRLILATPAFLAGAEQQANDCDLRPASLRGQLRWWWRTMHAGHLGRDALRQLETAIWGDAQNGAALSLAIRPVVRPLVRLFDFKNGSQPKADFQREHNLERPQPGAKTTQGLFYASYGMDEMNRGEKRQRWYVEPGATWSVTLIARRTEAPLGGGELSAAKVLQQAEAALWLLACHGAIGSKARKGFGAFVDLKLPGIRSVEDCKSAASDLRRLCRLPGGRTDAPSLDEAMNFETVTPWSDPWFAMDQVGSVYQKTVRSFRADTHRTGLGLPRNVGRRPGRSRKPGQIDRHASPLHWSLSREEDGRLRVRLTAFPPARLPDLRSFVIRELEKRKQRLEKRGRGNSRTPRDARNGRPERVAGRGMSGHPAPASDDLPPNGEEIQAVLLEERNRKGKWRARHIDSNKEGTIDNSDSVPPDAEADQEVTLLVVNRTDFLWPDEAARARFASKSSKRRTPPARPPRNRR